MEIQQIRNATIILSYGGKRFLIDPMFAPKNAYEAIPQGKSTSNWPLVDLPMTPKEIISDIDTIIVTHYHIDHFDEYAVNTVRKGVKVYIQDEYEKEILRKLGFTNLEVLTENGSTFAGIRLDKAKCRHGIKEKVMPYYNASGIRYESMGIVFSHPNEETLYLAGDTIWCDEVKEVIDRYSPKYIIVNCADAQTGDSGSIIMGTADLQELHNYAPDIKIIASHLDTVSHATIGRKEIKKFVKDKKFADKVLIPKDGEIIKINTIGIFE